MEHAFGFGFELALPRSIRSGAGEGVLIEAGLVASDRVVGGPKAGEREEALP